MKVNKDDVLEYIIDSRDFKYFMSNTIEHYIQTKQVKTFGVSEQLEELLSNAVFVLKEIPKKGKGKNFYA